MAVGGNKMVIKVLVVDDSAFMKKINSENFE